MGDYDYNNELNELIRTYHITFSKQFPEVRIYILKLTGLDTTKKQPFLTISKELIHSAIEHTIVQQLLLKKESKYDLYLLKNAIMDIQKLHKQIMDNPDEINKEITIIENKIKEQNNCIKILTTLNDFGIKNAQDIKNFSSKYKQYVS